MNKSSYLKENVFMIIGSFLMALCTKCVFDRAEFVTGGFSGIAILIKAVSGQIVDGGIPLWLTTLILNIPLFIICLWVLGIKFIRKTMFTTLMLTFWLYVLPKDLFLLNDNFLIAVFGAIISGVSIGMVFSISASTGGTDTLAVLLTRMRPDLSAYRILQLIDGAIVITAGIVFGIEKTLYSLIAVYIAAKVSGTILEGINYAKQVYIISDSLDRISEKIMSELHRGMTLISSKGAFSGKEKKMAMCIVSKKQLSELKEIVKENDPNAFMVVNDTREVLGEGFIVRSNM